MDYRGDERWRSCISLVRRWVIAAIAFACLLPVGAAGTGAPAGIAPVFSHGTGIARFDLESPAPYILTDEDAWEIIGHEAASAGLRFTPGNRELTLAASADGNLATRGGTVPLDGVDAAHKVAFLYLSLADANAARRRLAPDGPEELNLAEYAVSVRARVTIAPEGACAIFYDPLVAVADVIPLLNESEHYVADLEDIAREIAEKALRRQVRDFLAWYQK